MSTPGEKSLEQRGMTMRVAQPGDLARILEIVEAARAFLAAEGIDQWQKGTPAPSDFERDIELGWGRVVVLDDQIVGYAALIDGPEPYYGFVYSGEWHPRPGSHGVVTPPDDYYTIHRVAIAASAWVACCLPHSPMRPASAAPARCASTRTTTTCACSTWSSAWASPAPARSACTATARTSGSPSSSSCSAWPPRTR